MTGLHTEPSDYDVPGHRQVDMTETAMMLVRELRSPSLCKIKKDKNQKGVYIYINW